MIVASGSGGMEIEDLAEADPDSLVRMSVDPAVGLAEFQARELAFALGLNAGQIAKMVTILRACYRAYRDHDAMMVEINPLVVTGSGDLVALDAKMSFDTNALFRRPQIAELRDRSQEDPRESTAADHGLAYVGLDGNIGCIINGAGLAMATLDMIKLAGGEPANFLDIGGGASPERVVKRLPHRADRQERRGDPRQHLRRHQPLRLGRRRRGRGLQGTRHHHPARGAPCRHQRRRGPRDHPRLGPADHHADTLADAAAKAVAALPRKAA
jgi:malate-CoA ligase subunit beta